jgi:hypothetical protein
MENNAVLWETARAYLYISAIAKLILRSGYLVLSSIAEFSNSWSKFGLGATKQQSVLWVSQN